MKQVVLIGDSIRKGYQPYVAEALEGVAEVWGPEENCGPSERTVANLDEWIRDRKADVFHINAGLHDLKKDLGETNSLASIAEYRKNLETIFEAALETGAKVIWATTTPVDEKNHRERKGFDRFEADVDRYNAAALEVVQKFGLPINDLFAFVMESGKDSMLRPDGVHFLAEGARKLGLKVAEEIRKVL